MHVGVGSSVPPQHTISNHFKKVQLGRGWNEREILWEIFQAWNTIRPWAQCARRRVQTKIPVNLLPVYALFLRESNLSKISPYRLAEGNSTPRKMTEIFLPFFPSLLSVELTSQ